MLNSVFERDWPEKKTFPTLLCESFEKEKFEFFFHLPDSSKKQLIAMHEIQQHPSMYYCIYIAHVVKVEMYVVHSSDVFKNRP